MRLERPATDPEQSDRVTGLDEVRMATDDEERGISGCRGGGGDAQGGRRGLAQKMNEDKTEMDGESAGLGGVMAHLWTKINSTIPTI